MSKKMRKTMVTAAVTSAIAGIFCGTTMLANATETGTAYEFLCDATEDGVRYEGEGTDLSVNTIKGDVVTTANEEIALSIVMKDVPVMVVALASDSQMEAQVILGDGTFKPSNRLAIEEGKDYTFLVNELDMTKDDFGNLILTFDFADTQLSGEDIEEINLDVTELKVNDVQFNVEGANFDKSSYNGGFRLFDIISADADAYGKAFSSDGDSSGTAVLVDRISVSIHVNTLKLKEEEFDETDAPETTVVTEPVTTEPTLSTTQPVGTTSAPAVTTAAATTTTTVVTTTVSGDNVPPAPTGDSGVGVAAALLAVSASLAFAARKLED